MASFRTHISFGVAAGLLGVIGLISLAITNAPGLLLGVFALATLGSVLPDMDSDSGLPFHIAFGSLTITSCVLVFISLYNQGSYNWQQLFAWTAGIGIAIWVGIGTLFKRLTHHRGMAHSVPAAVLAGLITFFAAVYLDIADADAFLLALAVAVGYIVHLLLDEFHAAINFHGTIFIPNKAFGSALKLKSESRRATMAVYGVICLLAAGNTQRLLSLAESLWSTISHI